MNSPFNQYKEKQLYCSKLLNKNPDIYKTYKRMVLSKKSSLSNLNTSHASIETINKSMDNESSIRNNKTIYNSINNSTTPYNSKKNYKNKKNGTNNNKPHLSYLGFLKAKGFPFFYNEKRFQWQNLQANNFPGAINTFAKHKDKFKFNDCSQKEIILKRSKKSVPSALNEMSFNRTKRVINSEVNEKDGDYFSKRHKKNPNLKKLQQFLNVGEGSMEAFLNKTPLKFNYRGIRMVKRSNSYDLNLFTENYAKSQLPRRRHYKQKDDIKEILNFRKSNSFDYLTHKQNRICGNFKYKLYLNPINWSFNKHCYFCGKKNNI